MNLKVKQSKKVRDGDYSLGIDGILDESDYFTFKKKIQ